MNGKHTKIVLALSATVVETGLLAALMLMPIPSVNKDLFSNIAMLVTGCYGGVMGYYFGSSAGQDHKTEKDPNA